MHLKSVECVFLAICVLGVRCQRGWGGSNNGGFSNGYNTGFSNSWNSGFGGNSGISNRPSGFGNTFGNSRGSGSNAGESLNSNGRPNDGIYSVGNNKNPNSYEISSSGNSGSWQSGALSVRPNEEKPTSFANSENSFKWGNNNRPEFPSWESGKPVSSTSNNQNSAGDWNSNFINGNNLNNNGNIDNENEVSNDADYDNSIISWNSSNKKKLKPTSSSFANKKKTVTENSYKSSGTSKWESSYTEKPQKSSGNNNWSSNVSSKPQNEKTQTNNKQPTTAKPSTLDTSILDELDKNDWYFGKESNYPKPPFKSSLNIDVSELWNFDRNRKTTKQNSRGSGNNNNNRNNSSNKNNKNNSRRNRQIARMRDMKSIECECVNVNSCDEDDMIISQKDVAFDSRPLEAFRCKELTEVCCKNPKTRTMGTTIVAEDNRQLQCGERRLGVNPFGEFDVKIAQPGEFPWLLNLENTKENCSASLIHHRLALTAAHCISGAHPNELTLKAGVWNSNDESSQTRRVSRIIPHPGYDSQNPRNDIALLVVEEPFELTENVNPVCLPVTNDKWDSSECIVAGWSWKNIAGQVVEVLEKGTVNFLPQVECQNIMLVTDLWRDYILHDSFVCGKEKTGRQSCTGDDGGFVICPSKKRKDTFLQIGVVSEGMNCDNFGRPGIFTNVLKFLDWINKNYFELGLFDDIDVRSLA